MSDDPPSFHAIKCKLDGCEWSSLRSSWIRLYADMEEHMKEEHGYSESEWEDARSRLQEAGAP